MFRRSDVTIRVSRTLGYIGCLVAAGSLAGCGALDRGFLSPGGPIAGAIRDEFLLVCLVMLFVIGPVLLLVPLIAWHYRLSNTKSAYRPQWGFSWPLEGLIWIPPTPSSWAWRCSCGATRTGSTPTSRCRATRSTVQAIAADWKWIFIYPGRASPP